MTSVPVPEQCTCSPGGWILLGPPDGPRPLAAIPSRAWCTWHRENATDGRRPHVPRWLRNAVYERDGRACLHCGSTERLSLDHIYPRSLGGPDALDNLQTLCVPCNSKKGART